VFGSLDETRRFNVVELLRGLQDRFEQVILITHIDSVREGLDRLITVGYDPGSGKSLVRQEKIESSFDGGLDTEGAGESPEPDSERGAAA